jgi:hypothetical protein
MPNLIIQPASDKNAQRHYVDTVLNPVALDRMQRYLDSETLERLKALYKGGEIPVWGFTPGMSNSNVRKWDRIQSGDVALFLRQKFVFASSTVAFKIHNHDLAVELWGYDQKQRTWEYIYFLDEVQNQRISYGQLNDLLGYESKNNFQQALVLDAAKGTTVIAALDLESAIYEPAPSRESYLKAVEPSEETALDKVVTAKARTEQSYLRYVNFKQHKYAVCGICHKEFPISFLVAAHIKKRQDCSDEERRDYEHITMPMCKFGCDELYEKGYIGVDVKVIVANDENLSSVVLDYLSAIEGNDCEYWNNDTAEYFSWHNQRMKLAGQAPTG